MKKLKESHSKSVKVFICFLFNKKTIMFIFTTFTAVFFTFLALKYSEFFQKIIGVYVDDNVHITEDIIYGKHPMSDNDDEGDSDYDESEDDFYEETTLTEEWLSKTDEEKKQMLDKEIDEYMEQKKQSDLIETHLKNIKC